MTMTRRARPPADRWCELCRAHGDHHTARHLWSVDELAVHLRVSRMTIYRLVNAGTIPSTRVGRSIRIYHQHVVAYLNRTTQ